MSRESDIWRDIFGRIAWRKERQCQWNADKRDAMIYRERKRLQREGLIRKGR